MHLPEHAGLGTLQAHDAGPLQAEGDRSRRHRYPDDEGVPAGVQPGGQVHQGAHVRRLQQQPSVPEPGTEPGRAVLFQERHRCGAPPGLPQTDDDAPVGVRGGYQQRSNGSWQARRDPAVLRVPAPAFQDSHRGDAQPGHAPRRQDQDQPGRLGGEAAHQGAQPEAGRGTKTTGE